MATLYRDYRPQNFKELVGQNHIKITLQHEIESGKITHAYLFCGPRGIGKTTIARVLSKSINCLERKDKEHEPCNVCEACQTITVGRNLDIIEVDAASHTGVDNVRENIIAAARVAPVNSKNKVFIIDEVHMLSVSAFNALLKVLEEPPTNVVFILCTTEVHKIPATIISRCQRFDFKRISITDIVKKLQYIINKENIKIDNAVLESIARHSEGHMRDAESLLGQVVSIGGKEITTEEADLVIPRSDLAEAIKLISFLTNKDAGSGIALVSKIMDEGINLKRFLSDLIELLRKIMIAKINPALSDKLGLELGESMEIEVNKITSELELKYIILMLEKLIEARKNLKESFIMQLPVEIAIIDICSGGQTNINTNTQPINKVPIQNKQQIAPSSPVVEKVKTLPSVPNNNAVNISQADIQAKWNEVLAKIKKYNHSLSFILRVCQPKDLNGNQLCLAFKYKFHKDRISEASIKKIVEGVLHDVYGQKIIIEAIIDESIETSNGNGQVINETVEKKPSFAKATEGKTEEKDNKTIDNLLKTFGGKVVS